jgi:hypothetical protein
MATATTVAFYTGTAGDFAADAASASSALGSFTPGNSGYTTLNAALAGGMVIATQEKTAFRQNVPNATVNTNNLSGSATQAGFVWTLQYNSTLV